MTSLATAPNCPCWVPPPTKHTNNRWDFLRTIIWLVDEGGIVEGDIVIMDNARIHDAAESRVVVAAVLDVVGARLIFLPAYSPELNPCELVFSHVKRAMAAHRGGGGMWEEALSRFHAITLAQMDAWHKHCIMAPLG